MMRSLMILTAVLLTGLHSQASFKAPKAQKYKIDTDVSLVKWSGEKHALRDADSKHTGTIKLQSGELTITDGKITGGELVVDMNSIKNTDLPDAKKPKLEGHLKSDDFFSVANYPTAKFVVKSVKHKSGNNKEVSGIMTIHGKENPETFILAIKQIGSSYKATGKITLDRVKYGITWHSEAGFFNKIKNIEKIAKDKVIKDKIVLNLDLLAKAS